MAVESLHACVAVATTAASWRWGRCVQGAPEHPSARSVACQQGQGVEMSSEQWAPDVISLFHTQTRNVHLRLFLFLSLSFFCLRECAVFRQPRAGLGSGGFWRKGHTGPVWEEGDLNVSKKKKKRGCDMDTLYALLINVSQAPSLPAS